MPATAQRRQKTTRKKLHATEITKAASRDALSVDTVANPVGFTLSGYEKPLRSTRETIFVTNSSDTDASGIELEIVYFDIDGRELHRRVVALPADLPLGSTRRIDFSSWDRQQTFYFADGPRPRRQAYPYTISARVTAIHILRPE